MRTSRFRLAQFAALSALAGMLMPVYGGDTKPDKKKSQAAWQRGKKADDAGQRAEAIAAYSDAIAADPSNVEALRSRGKDYQATGDKTKAQADFDRAIELQPGSAESYVARGGFLRRNRATGAGDPRFHAGDQPEDGA